jgi:hypothetical protein
MGRLEPALSWCGGRYERDTLVLVRDGLERVLADHAVALGSWVTRIGMGDQNWYG